MFIRLNLLRHNGGSSVQWPRKLFEENKFRTRLKIVRNCSDIKCNEERFFGSQDGGIVIPSTLKVRQTIKSGFYDYVDGFTCIQTSCPTCQPDNEQKTTNIPDKKVIDNKCLYINKTTGDVVCSKCQHIFSFSAVEKFFSKSYRSTIDMERARDLFLRSKPKISIQKSYQIPKDAIPITEIGNDEIQEIIEHLGLHDIELSVLQNVQAFCHAKRKTLYFPMLDVHSNIIGYKKLSRLLESKLTETTIPEKNSFGAVIFPPIIKRGFRDQRTAILVVNMMDALALRMEKTNVTIICLPYGFKTLPQECLPLFESYAKLILWFDYNSVGWDMAKMFAKKLDEKRCHFIRPTENTPTPYVAIQQSIPTKTILTAAQPIVHKAVTTFRALRQDVLSDIQNIDKVQGIKWNRYPTLNKYLKGHRRGELTILTGPTGCGKTTFMAEYSLDLSMQGVNTLWGSFEIRNTLLARTLLQQMARKPLDENIEEFDTWANQFEQLPMYFMTFYGQQTLKIVMEAIEHSQYVHDIHHVIIDNLQFMMGTSDPRSLDKYWRQDEIIAAFRTFATKRNCHVTLVIHPRKERNDEDLTMNSIFGSAKATQEADNVLIIQDKRLVSVKGKKYLQIAKNRFSGDLGIMMLNFDRDALSYA
ncbi:twinkle protein, mitochondrial [Contarinia nasturtii]|uniref:twinkle protein, mitochondrial n=1 Tax=Contarinia nasturtii TaxID=265458 RepID=UPI0012D3B616|nr:twinkle protein, mitochondrial [Contarinia nasturtii]